MEEKHQESKERREGGNRTRFSLPPPLAVPPPRFRASTSTPIFLPSLSLLVRFYRLLTMQ